MMEQIIVSFDISNTSLRTGYWYCISLIQISSTTENSNLIPSSFETYSQSVSLYRCLTNQLWNIQSHQRVVNLPQEAILFLMIVLTIGLIPLETSLLVQIFTAHRLGAEMMMMMIMRNLKKNIKESVQSSIPWKWFMKKKQVLDHLATK